MKERYIEVEWYIYINISQTYQLQSKVLPGSGERCMRDGECVCERERDKKFKTDRGRIIIIIYLWAFF